MTYVEGKLDGPLVNLVSDPIRLAVGAGYRNEQYSENSTIGLSRNRVCICQARAPIVKEDLDRVGLVNLVVSAAVRYEHYSEFGDLVNPKVGISYTPVQGLALRATGGTSFQA